MIKCKDGTITVSGYTPVIKAELSTLLQFMRQKFGDSFVDICVEDSRKTREELDDENIRIAKFVSSLTEILKS